MPDCIKSLLYKTIDNTGIITPSIFSLQLRPGFDPSRLSEAVDTIEVPSSAGQGSGLVSGLVASQYGLMAVVQGRDQKMFIYYQERTAVLEFPLDCYYTNQLTFDRHHNIVIAQADHCINVLAASDGKLKRQIGCDKYRDGEMSKVEGIFATSDGYLFVCDQDYNVHAFTSGGDHLCRFGGNDDTGQFQPWAITVDWNGYLLISDIENGCIQVY